MMMNGGPKNDKENDTDKKELDTLSVLPSSFQHQHTRNKLKRPRTATATATATGTNVHSRTDLKVALFHSKPYAQLLYDTLSYIHKDRDLLLHSLLYACGFLKQVPHFFKVKDPLEKGCAATRADLEAFHTKDYLDWIQHPPVTHPCHSSDAALAKQQHQVLDSHGLVDDCPLLPNPMAPHLLHKYICSMSGASLSAARLLRSNQVQVAIHWGGGRHHAHPAKASGFCYVNDVVLAIQELLLQEPSSKHEIPVSTQPGKKKRRVLYLDLDIHHADGVQSAFYKTDLVFTISFHRRAPGFFPSTSGSTTERGHHGTPGVGYNLNLELPPQLQNAHLWKVLDRVLENIVPLFDPEAIVVCLGADGLKGDALVHPKGQGGKDGWNLTPEGLAECIRRIAWVCGGRGTTSSYCTNSTTGETVRGTSFDGGRQGPLRQLLVLGGGGYTPSETARSWVLATAAACEAVRPGMMWDELPKSIPQHEYFDQYGPSYVLVDDNQKLQEDTASEKNLGTSCQSPTIKGLRCGDGIIKTKSRIESRSTGSLLNGEYNEQIQKAMKAIQVTHLFLTKEKRKSTSYDKRHSSFSSNFENEIMDNDTSNSTDWTGGPGSTLRFASLDKKVKRGRRRRRGKI